MTQKQMLAMLRKIINDEQATGFTEGGNLEEPEGTQELLNYNVIRLRSSTKCR